MSLDAYVTAAIRRENHGSPRHNAQPAMRPAEQANTGTKGEHMQEYVKRLRKMEQEAKAGLDRQAKLYEQIRAERVQAEATTVSEQEENDQGCGKLLNGPWVAAVIVAAGALAKILFGSLRRTTITTSVATVAAGGIALTAFVTNGQTPDRNTVHRPAAAPPVPPLIRPNPPKGNPTVPPRSTPTPPPSTPDLLAAIPGAHPGSPKPHGIGRTGKPPHGIGHGKGHTKPPPGVRRRRRRPNAPRRRYLISLGNLLNLICRPTR